MTKKKFLSQFNEEVIQQSLPLRFGHSPFPFFVSAFLIIQSARYPLRCHCVYRERRACRVYACTLDNDEGLPRRAGQPSWLTSSRAPSTQPRNADFLVAIAPYFLLLLSPILSLVYPPPGASFPSPSALPISLFSLFFLFPRRVRIVDGVVCRRSRFGCETKRDTPPSIHVKWRNLIERRYSPVAVGVEAEAVHRFLSLLFLFHSCGDCEGRGLPIDSLITYNL